MGKFIALAVCLFSIQLAGCMPMPTQQSAEEAIDDGVVTARIKERLTEDPITKPHVIKVETFRGTVELSGFVETDQVRDRALELARDVSGVRRVRDAMDTRNPNALKSG
jgi:osmotically-inducible protein OsmY